MGFIHNFPPYDSEREPCEHPDAEYHAGSPARFDEPGSAEGWYCPDCDQWVDIDEATRLGI